MLGTLKLLISFLQVSKNPSVTKPAKIFVSQFPCTAARGQCHPSLAVQVFQLLTSCERCEPSSSVSQSPPQGLLYLEVRWHWVLVTCDISLCLQALPQHPFVRLGCPAWAAAGSLMPPLWVQTPSWPFWLCSISINSMCTHIFISKLSWLSAKRVFRHPHKMPAEMFPSLLLLAFEKVNNNWISLVLGISDTFATVNVDQCT